MFASGNVLQYDQIHFIGSVKSLRYNNYTQHNHIVMPGNVHILYTQRDATIKKINNCVLSGPSAERTFVNLSLHSHETTLLCHLLTHCQ